MRVLLVLILALAAVVPEASARMRAVAHRSKPWVAPACTVSTGLPSFGLLHAGTVTRSDKKHDPWVPIFTSGLTLGATPNTLYAVNGGALYESTDAGCTWQVRADAAEMLLARAARVITKHPQHIYVYTRQDLLRVTYATVQRYRLPTEMERIEVDPADPLHLRSIALTGFVQDSFDGGATWKAVGIPRGSRVLASEFDPRNFDRIILHTGQFGTLAITNDGGKSWTYPASAWWRVDALEISPADPNVIWLSGAPGLQNPELFRSTDGGQTFTLIVDYTSGMTSLSDNMAAHPTDPQTVAVPMNIGVGIVTGGSVDQKWTGAGMQEAVWSPSGTLYFVDEQIRY